MDAMAPPTCLASVITEGADTDVAAAKENAGGVGASCGECKGAGNCRQLQATAYMACQCHWPRLHALALLASLWLTRAKDNLEHKMSPMLGCSCSAVCPRSGC